MLNKFPLWKNSLILIAALFAFVYASPNYFPADAAIQLSGQSGSMIIDEDVLKKMEYPKYLGDYNGRKIHYNHLNI